MATSTVKSGRSASPKMMRNRISPFSKLLNQVATGLRQSADDFSQVKLMLQIDGHLAADVIENMRDPAQMFDELFKLFKVTKTDIDLLEDLVRDAGKMLDFQEGLKEFKRESRYESIEPSPERNAHAIADKLEKLLHNDRSKESSGVLAYLQHYGKVKGFGRERLHVVKSDICSMLGIKRSQFIFITKYQEEKKEEGYVCIYQLPASRARKLIAMTKSNDDRLLGLGLRAVRLTGHRRVPLSMPFKEEELYKRTFKKMEELSKLYDQPISALESGILGNQLAKLAEKHEKEKTEVTPTPTKEPERPRLPPISLPPAPRKPMISSSLPVNHLHDENKRLLLQTHSLQESLVSQKLELVRKTEQVRERELQVAHLERQVSMYEQQNTNLHKQGLTMARKLQDMRKQAIMLEQRMKEFQIKNDLYRTAARTKMRFGNQLSLARRAIPQVRAVRPRDVLN
ncbi:uncharacterized protein LOC118432007 [Branchiostoma floridae]|nr:uncharacterized protein LOC118432007 [Branchiostoma floridae]XP_035699365.1 uncharacterized protein LOC118432007 [Branchiostoma floridae]